MGERAFFSVDLINSWAPIPASGWMVSKAAPCNQVPLADFLPSWTMFVQWPVDDNRWSLSLKLFLAIS